MGFLFKFYFTLALYQPLTPRFFSEKAPKVRVLEPELAEPAAEEAPVDDEVPEASNGPRVRVGPNGEITLDEESLVVRRQAVRPEARALVYETGSETSYTSFRRQPQSRRTWTAKETARFYRALSVCGTDFTLMASFFPKRTRQDLKARISANLSPAFEHFTTK